MRIIADDLSGAADAGVPFAARLILHPEDADWRDARVAAVAVDTGGRERDETATVARLARELPAGAEVLKKVDSALRGRVAEELDALLGVLADRVAVVAPAFPRAGRVTRAGVQHVAGVLLHESDAWSAETGAPPRSVAEALGRPAVVARGADELERALGGTEAIVCDADSDADLDTIVQAVRRAGAPVVWVGSAGLAAALARSRPPGAPPASWVAEPGRYLAVVGSASAVARRQAAALVADGADSFELRYDGLADEESLAAELYERVQRRSVVVTVAGHLDGTASAAVARSLGRIAAPAAAEVPLLALTGGATARAVLEQCGVAALDLLAEPEPGVALAAANGRRVVTKAGAFGDDGTLVRVLHGGRR